ncbi:TonB-dependent receptor [Pontibacter harenae]|uniref:TonB-dependent receptor n=1 Tax=Pontibacter harenae TaxID=2894083 RepID=UPI001E3C6D5A|nr:carboxypeptidase-like regulatory domain-containing protein [Pontibacter harenae]MCC9167399.1 TonB-dependent receptor [Pontibacter harenae]
MIKYLWLWLLLMAPLGLAAQQATVTGSILNQLNEPLELATIGIKGSSKGVLTNADGQYSFTVPAAKELVLEVRYVGYLPQEKKVKLAANQTLTLNFVLQLDPRQLNTVDVRGKNEQDTREQVSLTKLDPKNAKELPSAFGDFNKILSTLPGVTSNNELSSTYSVRGGNYDENLVYVNGIEIYRPFLITNGQQEGLSFVNPDLVDNITFSSGGWQPKYGDKLSSVLDITYKKPTAFAGSVTGGLTGGAIHLEGASANNKASFVLGLRHKNGQYLLNSLQVEGEYRPLFTDAQAYFHYDLSGKGQTPERTTIGVLASVAQNDYEVVPVTRITSFGTTQQVVRVTVGYDGREQMDYSTYQLGLNLQHQFRPSFTSNLILSGVQSLEREYRDLEAGYRLCDIDNNPGSSTYGECLQSVGLGTQFDHARNKLLARMLTAESRNNWRLNSRSHVAFGAKVGLEDIEDQLQEYGFTDSADYVSQNYLLHSQLSLNSLRYNAFAQHTYEIDSLKTITYGVRASYWSYNKEMTLTPRLQYSFITRKNPDLSFKAAIGLYYQPPFYRELRNMQGELNPELKAQRSLHAIVGSDYIFQSWGRDFKLSAEAYYKHMTNVVPYDIDNVRLRYYAQNNAKAYATGFDVRVNGEFIEGAESWFSVGFLRTRENVSGDSAVVYNNTGEAVGQQAIGFIRRPTDQLLNIGVFFQDHLPNNPTMRMYLNLAYASGLPFGPPNQPAYRNAFSGKSYKRVDTGFSKQIVFDEEQDNRKALALESLWLGLEVLNLIDANNRVSYNYITDVNGIVYALPNYLTGRRLNLRVIARF